MNGLFATFLGSLVSLAVCMLAGFICRRAHVLDDTITRGLSTMLMKVTLPCTVFVSLMRPFSRALLLESAATFILSGVVYLFGGLLGWLLARLFKTAPSERRCWVFALIFANVGYMGFPVTQAVYGDDGMIYASMANMAFNLLAFTVGVRLFDPGAGKAAPSAQTALPGKTTNTHVQLGQRLAARVSRMLRSRSAPALIATLIGLMCFVTGLRLPKPFQDGVSLLGGMTTPISMLLVGAIIAKSPLRSLFTDWRVLPVVVTRLVVVPVCAFAVLRLFVQNHLMLSVMVMLSAMPVAALTTIFAEQYQGEVALASRLVALSTLLCVVIVPPLALLLGIL